jgi:hypothetical protein
MPLNLLLFTLLYQAPDAAAPRTAFLPRESITLSVPATGTGPVSAIIDGESFAAERAGKTARVQVPAYRFRPGKYSVTLQGADGKPIGSPAALTIGPYLKRSSYPVVRLAPSERIPIAPQVQNGFNVFSTAALRTGMMPGDRFDKLFTAKMDEALAVGADFNFYLNPFLQGSEEQSPNVPGLTDTAVAAAKSLANTFGRHPAWKSTLLNSENEATFAASDTVKAAFQAKFGKPLASVLDVAWVDPVRSRTIPTRAPGSIRMDDAVVPDTSPLFQAMRWWQTEGSGLYPANQKMTDAIHAVRADVETWTDPYRWGAVPPSGSDAISTWTYGTPDPRRILYTSVLAAAARQGGMKSRQTISLAMYPYFTEPQIRRATDDRAAGTKLNVLPPDVARFQASLAWMQRPDALQYYNWSQSDPDELASTLAAVGAFHREAVIPFGDTLLQTRPTPAKVAVLFSPSTQWFGKGAAEYGYPNEYILPTLCALSLRHIPFEVIFDGDLAGANRFDAVIVPRPVALLESSIRQLEKLITSGTQVILTQKTPVVVRGAKVLDLDWSFTTKATGIAAGKGIGISIADYDARLADAADALAAALPRNLADVRVDNDDILVNGLTSGSVRYVMALNGKFDFGPKYGAAKLFRETGVATTGKLTFPAGSVYDVLESKAVSTKPVALSLPPVGLKIFALLANPVGGVRLSDGPPTLDSGKTASFSAAVNDRNGKAILGAVPVRATLIDPSGRTVWQAYRSTVISGQSARVRLDVSLARNEPAGKYRLEVKELLSGTTDVADFTFRP